MLFKSLRSLYYGKKRKEKKRKEKKRKEKKRRRKERVTKQNNLKVKAINLLLKKHHSHVYFITNTISENGRRPLP